MNIPRKSKDLSLAWLNNTLANQFGEITAFGVEVIGGGEGVLGELARISLAYKEPTDKPESIVAKFASPLQETRDFAVAMGFYENEHRFYDELSEAIDIRIPERFFSNYEPESGHFTLLMSDVEGKVCDQLEGCNLTQAMTAVRDMARLHSFGYRTDWQQKSSWVRPLIEDQIREIGIASLKTHMPGSMSLFEAACPDWLTDNAETFPDLLYPLTDQIHAYPHTLIHGDFRADNLVFSDAGDMTLLDWQLIFSAPGAFDLGYFFSQSLDTELRRAQSDDLLDTYFAELEQCGIKADRKEYIEVLRLAAAYCLVYPLIGGGLIDHSYERSVLLMNTMFSRACMTIEDYDAVSLIADN